MLKQRKLGNQNEQPKLSYQEQISFIQTQDLSFVSLSRKSR